MMIFNEAFTNQDIDNMLFDTKVRNEKFGDLNYSYEDKKKFNDMQKNISSQRTSNFLIKLKRILTDKPREFISKIASRLREVYRKWLAKANKEKDANKLKWYKNILRLILKGIDFVMKKLENIRPHYSKRLYKAIKNSGALADDKAKDATRFSVGTVSEKDLIDKYGKEI